MTELNRVGAWNLACGKLPIIKDIAPTSYWQALANQQERLQEELDELNEAIMNCQMLEASSDCAEVTLQLKGVPFWATNTLSVREHWNDEVLDAQVDLDVVLQGFTYLSGHDHNGAFNAVMENNDLKYLNNLPDAQYACEEIGATTHSVVTGNLGNTPTYSIHRNSDDKITKLPNHPKVCLKKFAN